MIQFPYKLTNNSKVATALCILCAVASPLFGNYLFPGEKAVLLLSLALSAFLLVVGFIKIAATTDRAATALNILWGFLAIAMLLGPSLPAITTERLLLKLLLNYLCAMFLLGIVFAITTNWKASINVTMGILALLLVVNAVVLCFRGKEFSLMDIRSINTALSVAGQYRFTVTRRFFLTCVTCIIAFSSQFCLPAMPKLKVSKVFLRIGAMLGAVIAVLAVVFGSTGLQIYTWYNEGSQFNGYFLNFYIGIRESQLKSPQDYAPQILDQYAHQYNAEFDSLSADTYPNIIVIMNESFVDFKVFQDPLVTNIPVTPFIDSLSENTIKGYAMTSVYGGNTANEEFEFLTGHSMAFLPQYAVAYQQYISGKMYSIAHLMSAYGYHCMATHPYEATGWSRSIILPFLGFDDYTAQECYPNENILRKYISDQEMMEYVLECLYAQEDQPLFLMGITMQNHGGYGYSGDDFQNTISLVDYPGQFPQTEQYLSLIHESDRAMEYLLTALENYEKDTIVLFFGDHFPSIDGEIFSIMNGSAIDTLEEQMLQYTVPFFIWANYDIPEAEVERTSISYLSLYLMETAGIKLPAYHRAMKDIQKVIPAINAFGYYSIEQAAYIPLEKATGKEAEMLAMYQILQYNNLADTNNRNDALFARYID